MHDTFTIRHNGQTYSARRYLRLDDGKTYQTIFYLGSGRSDPAAYANFASDDPAMNASAAGMLAEMVDERARRADHFPQHGH
jgi:hypothetical protein